jgi:hypothetical protein
VTSPTAFAERYLVASFGDEGVVADLETGNYFRVEGATARICEILAERPDSAIDRVASALQVSPIDAGRMVTDVRVALDTAAVRGTPSGSYHFHPESGGYGLWHQGKRVLGLRGDDLEIQLPPNEGIEKSPFLEMYVRALAPKIMFLRGITVLHASACVAHDVLVAFSGQSGAGKTTTARAFAEAGAWLVSEDLVVLKAGEGPPAVVLDGEARVYGWAKQTAAAFAAGAGRLPSTELGAMADDEAKPLAVLHFLDVNRRLGLGFVTRKLKGADALLALMTNHFLGDVSRDGWRRFLALDRTWVDKLTHVELTAPAGIEALTAAAAGYMSTWTSYAPTGAGASPSHA